MATCTGCTSATPMYPGTNIVTYYACIVSEDPGDGNPNGGGGGGGSSTNPNNPQNNDNSISVILNSQDSIAPKHKSNCKALKQLVANDSLGSNILPIVNQLRAKLNTNKEWSVDFKNTWVDGNRKNLPDENGIREGVSKTRSKFKYGTTWVGQIHTHPEGTFKIFSWLDLEALQKIHTNVHQHFIEEVFLMAVAPNNETYALKVDDIQTLIDKINEDMQNATGSNNDEKEGYIMEKMAEKYTKSNNLEKTFRGQ